MEATDAPRRMVPSVHSGRRCTAPPPCARFICQYWHPSKAPICAIGRAGRPAGGYPKRLLGSCNLVSDRSNILASRRDARISMLFEGLLPIVDVVAELILVTALLGELSIIVAQIISRSVWGASILWSDEVAHLALSTLTFFGGAVAYRRGHYASVAVATNMLPERGRKIFATAADSLVLFSALILLFSSLPLILSNWTQVTPVLEMPASIIDFPFVMSMFLLALYAIDRMWQAHRHVALIIGIPVAILAVTAQFEWPAWLGSDIAIYTSLTLFFVLIFAGLPVAFALSLAAVAYLGSTGAAPLESLPASMIAGTDNFVLLALPFFILAGMIMERGGISRRLIRFVNALVAHLRGGLLQVMIVSMYLVSGLSGSKSADVVAVGSAMGDMLKRHGYSSGETAAVLAASATMGETVPPSIALLVLGSITQLSVAALFIGGLMPAAVIGFCLMALVYVRARRTGVPLSQRTSLRSLAESSIGAVLPLLMPVLLFAGILTGVGTPTEVSSFAVIYGVILGTLVYREVNFGQMMRLVVDSAVFAGMVLLIISAASSFGFTLTIALVPQRLVTLLNYVGNSPAVFMIGSIVLLIVVGSLLEGLPALNILVPLLFPIATQLGISQLQYGVVLVISMGLGTFLPPVGASFYVCCAVAGSDLERASAAMVPYVIVLLISLLIIAFVPWFTLALPRYFGYVG